MEAWERRARKLEAKRERMNKHGRSLLTAVRNAEMRRAKAAKRGLRAKDSGLRSDDPASGREDG
jgi:hypothetical protein